MPALDRSALEAACRRVCDGTIRIPDAPENLDDIVTTQEVEELLEGYLHFATGFADTVERTGDDPNLIVRAVDYIAYRVAIPAFGQDVLWFRNCLWVLAQLASPEMFALPVESFPFHDDLARGLARAQAVRREQK